MERILQQFSDDGNCNGCGIYTLHRLALTIAWTGLANIAMIMPLFRQTILTYYIHSTIMWIVAICTAIGVFAEIVVWDGRLEAAALYH